LPAAFSQKALFDFFLQSLKSKIKKFASRRALLSKTTI
jgi:hypothetical protein